MPQPTRAPHNRSSPIRTKVVPTTSMAGSGIGEVHWSWPGDVTGANMPLGERSPAWSLWMPITIIGLDAMIHDNALASDQHININFVGLPGPGTWHNITVNDTDGDDVVRQTDSWSLDPSATPKLWLESYITGTFGPVSTTTVVGNGLSVIMRYIRNPG